MNATPDVILPLFEPIADLAYDATDHGIEYADGLLAYTNNPWYWSHSARYAILGYLTNRLVEIERWGLRANVPNCGIHLSLDNAHSVRFVRSLGGQTPPPGQNRRRKAAWTNHPSLPLDVGPERLPLVNLLMDWQVVNDEPVIHVSLPRGPWAYGAPMKVNWREPLPRPAVGGISSLSFKGDDGGDPLNVVVIEPSEQTGAS